MNNLLRTDVYKLGHMVQYVPGCNKVYSYLNARSDKNFQEIVFFGLQYYLEKYMTSAITPDMAEEMLDYYSSIIGPPSQDTKNKVYDLARLGYWPLEIKALPEGTVISPKNALMTITNTHPDFYWTVGYVESLLLKVWYPITVATHCYKYRKLVEKMFAATVDNDQKFLMPFMVHDFGFRGDSSEEGAGLSGVAHLASFTGSDTIPARWVAKNFYGPATEPIMLSVPASEHSVMCSFGRDKEIDAFRNMLDLYPEGIVSIVSDTFDVYKVLTEFCVTLKDKILARNGKTVFRPDSGNPEHIICGNPNAPEGSPEELGCIRLLDKMFGSTVNSKGYKVLNPKVGLIYGDGMYYERYERTLNELRRMGYASSNLVIGVGGILRNHSRDTLGMAIKATHVEVNGVGQDIEKDPVTDHGKKSHKGLIYVDKDGTHDMATPEQERTGLLKYVFRNGRMYNRTNLDEIRARINMASGVASL
jgi:nicotinamide phosphoribosyltransferase